MHNRLGNDFSVKQTEDDKKTQVLMIVNQAVVTESVDTGSQRLGTIEAGTEVVFEEEDTMFGNGSDTISVARYRISADQEGFPNGGWISAKHNVKGESYTIAEVLQDEQAVTVRLDAPITSGKAYLEFTLLSIAWTNIKLGWASWEALAQEVSEAENATYFSLEDIAKTMPVRYGSVVGLSIDVDEGSIECSIDGRKAGVMCTQSHPIKSSADNGGMAPIAIFPSGTGGFWSIGWEPFVHASLMEAPTLLSRLEETRAASLVKEASKLVGKKVEIVGTKREDLNGKRGEATAADTNAKGEAVYVVSVDGNPNPMKLKPANLLEVLPMAIAFAEAEAAEYETDEARTEALNAARTAMEEEAASATAAEEGVYVIPRTVQLLPKEENVWRNVTSSDQIMESNVPETGNHKSRRQRAMLPMIFLESLPGGDSPAVHEDLVKISPSPWPTESTTFHRIGCYGASMMMVTFKKKTNLPPSTHDRLQFYRASGKVAESLNNGGDLGTIYGSTEPIKTFTAQQPGEGTYIIPGSHFSVCLTTGPERKPVAGEDPWGSSFTARYQDFLNSLFYYSHFYFILFYFLSCAAQVSN